MGQVIAMEDHREPDVLPLDPKCPVCKGPHDAGELFDGSEHDCGSCGVLLVCVTYTDGTADMQRARPVSVPPSTGRERTRSLWKRRGRR